MDEMGDEITIFQHLRFTRLSVVIHTKEPSRERSLDIFLSMTEFMVKDMADGQADPSLFAIDFVLVFIRDNMPTMVTKFNVNRVHQRRMEGLALEMKASLSRGFAILAHHPRLIAFLLFLFAFIF